jgi:glutathione S-transferase
MRIVLRGEVMAVKFYRKEPCVFCERCRIALLEKGISFEEIMVDVRSKPDWFLALSPRGNVPVLKHDDVVVFDSAVINEYLDEAFPKVPLMPAMPDKRAKVRAWIGFANTQLHQSYMNILRAPPESFDAAVARFEADLTTLDQALEHSTKLDPYFNGVQLTLADVTYATLFDRFAVFPNLRNYDLPGGLRRVRLWMETLASRPSVVATRPSLEANLENCRRYLPESLRN